METGLPNKRYTIKNNAFLIQQMPTATDVRPFREWLKLGRCVRKGEKALKIWRPIQVKTVKSELGAVIELTSGKSTEETRQRFKLVSVFDISQTDPLPAKFCAECGSELAKEDAYCPECGTKRAA